MTTTHKEALQENMTRKSKFLIFLSLLCLALTVYAAGSRITLDSGKEMKPQIDEFKEWYGELGILEQAQWDLAFLELMDQDGSLSDLQAIEYKSGVVYVTPKGSVYHLNPNCVHIRTKDNVKVLDASLVPNHQYKKPCSTCGK